MRHRTWALAGAAVLTALIASGVTIAAAGAKPVAQAASESPLNTATVQKRALSAMISVNGTLTYQGAPGGIPFSIINQAQGIYTELPMPGQVIFQGRSLYRVNDNPVLLLYGATPAYRSLSAGVTGADVAELNADLVALGYATSAQLSPKSTIFGSATTVALEKLQSALGEAESGVLALGQAVFEPTAMRVTAITAQLGGTGQAGQTVLEASSTTRQVQVALESSQQTDVATGDRVTITLPNNQTTPGVVSSVGTVASCPPSASADGPGSTPTTPDIDSCASASSGSISTPTVNVGVTPSDPAATGMWDQAPVQVGITTASLPSALVVPVTALLAQSAGGYAVEVVGGAGINHLVPVSLGLFDDADGLVQVAGSDLAAGQQVVVPAT